VQLVVLAIYVSTRSGFVSATNLVAITHVHTTSSRLKVNVVVHCGRFTKIFGIIRHGIGIQIPDSVLSSILVSTLNPISVTLFSIGRLGVSHSSVNCVRKFVDSNVFASIVRIFIGAQNILALTDGRQIITFMMEIQNSAAAYICNEFN